MSSNTSTSQSPVQDLLRSHILKEQRERIDDGLRKKKRVIILAGPTGAGKTALGLMLAKQSAGEIISADSMQVYRGMDIGTAKVSKEERLDVPHHLVDIRDVNDPFNVVDFYYEARQCCQKILDRESVPIIVGGSGFYLHTLLFGPPSGPPSVDSVRQSLEEECEKLGSECLYERLMKKDPDYARTITAHDSHKIIRALEIMTLTQDKVSRLSWKERKQPLDYDFRCWFLYRPRSTLYQRIEARCDQMLEQGLIEETISLRKKGLTDNPSAAHSIGYRQCLEYLSSDRSEENYAKLVEQFKKASRHYAKRQFTWFRKEIYYRWLDLDLHDPETACDIVLTDYEKG